MIDVQGSTITHSHAIQNVGVTGLDYPLTVDIGGEPVRVAGRWSLSVSLPADQRGAHMSRFVESVDALGDDPVAVAGMTSFADQIRKNLEATRATCHVEFTWFRRVHAPVSKKSAFNPCQVTWNAVSCDQGASSVTLSVETPVKSLCPCSKAISDRGAHNQRSKVTVAVRVPAATAVAMPSVDKLVALVESKASSPVFPVLKRADEKFVTEHAYDNPGFVEDLVRAIAGGLQDIAGVCEGLAYRILVRNEESIHAHDCFAEITSKNW